MATLTTLVDGQVATVAPVNGNFTALNTQVSIGTADQVYRIPHAGGEGAFGNLGPSTLFSLGTGSGLGSLMACVYAEGSVTGTSGTGEDVLHSWTMPASTMTSGHGDMLIIESYGGFAANANTKTLRFKVGAATSIVLNPTTTAPNAKNWMAYLRLQSTGGAGLYLSGIVMLGGTAGVSPTLESAGRYGFISVDETASQVIAFTGEGTTSLDVTTLGTVIYLAKNPV